MVNLTHLRNLFMVTYKYKFIIACMYFSPFTEIIVDIVGAVIEIQAQGKCDTLNGIFCIAPGGSNAECYDLGNVPDQMRLEELNYIYNCCSNANEDMKLCLRTTVRSAMNNTLYTRVCDRSLCDISATPCVAATSKLIVAGK